MQKSDKKEDLLNDISISPNKRWISKFPYAVQAYAIAAILNSQKKVFKKKQLISIGN